VKKNSTPKWTMGLDVGKRNTNYAIGEGDRGGIRVVSEGVVKTTREALEDLLGGRKPMRVVLEVGRQSPWISRQLKKLGHEVIVADARKLALIYKSQKKNDREDARKLMELGHIDPELLSPIQHRSEKTQIELASMRSRDAAVTARTSLINHVRGACAAVGVTLESCSAPTFHKRMAERIPKSLQGAMVPLLKLIEESTSTIRQYDAQLEQLATKHPATEQLRQVAGVGPLTALCFVLTIEKPERFERSREVGPYLGLVPRQDDSGDSRKQLGISKAGDKMLRRLLVSSAQYILGPFGPDTDLQRWGKKLAERGGKNAKKRAVVAVARRLAVLLHSLWVTKKPYEPLRQADAEQAKTGKRERRYKVNRDSKFEEKPKSLSAQESA